MKDTQLSITSFFKTNKNNKNKLLKRHAQLNDTEIKYTLTNTKNNKLNYAKHQPTIEFNNIIKKETSKTASTSLFIKKMKDKKRKRNKQDGLKQLLKQESKRNIRSTKNVYSLYNPDHSSNVFSNKSSSFYPSSNDSIKSFSNSHSKYKYKPIFKAECFQSESLSSSNSVSIDSALKYINNKVKNVYNKVRKPLTRYYI